MAKKRRRKVRRVARRTSKRLGRRSSRGLKFKGNRMGIVIKNLFVFLALAVVSYVLSMVLQNETLKSLLVFLSIVFVLLSMAFLIILLVFLILKTIKKR